MEQALSKISIDKSILIFLSILGLAISIYGYYELISTVSAFEDILNVFETDLRIATEFVIQTHIYYGLFSVIGLLGLSHTLFDKISLPYAYGLLAINLLLMFVVRWLVTSELNHAILTMGIIQ